MELLPLLSLFVIGLSYGSTACMFSCMPFLAPLLTTNASTLKQASHVVLPFSIGRILSYTLIATIAFISSVWIKSLLENNTLFQLLLGTVTIGLGLYLLHNALSTKRSSCAASNKLSKITTEGSMTYLFVGALVSFTPCVPVFTLIGLSAQSGSLTTAVFYGLFFGLGAVLIPFIFYTFFVSNLLRGLILEFKKYTKIIEIFAASILMIVGIMVFTGTISL